MVRTIPTHEDEGATIASKPLEDTHETPGERRRHAAVAAVGVELSATGLVGREHDPVSETLEDRDGRAPDLREDVSPTQVMKRATRKARLSVAARSGGHTERLGPLYCPGRS